MNQKQFKLAMDIGGNQWWYGSYEQCLGHYIDDRQCIIILEDGIINIDDVVKSTYRVSNAQSLTLEKAKQLMKKYLCLDNFK